MNTSRTVRKRLGVFFAGIALLVTTAAAGPPGAMPADTRVLFLHHSTGECIWNGGVADWFRAYNAANGTRYVIDEQLFPKESPYGWENYPYDYWNIWVRHAGPERFQQEPTLEMLTPKYGVIVFKHCFPVSNIEADTGQPDITSSEKRVENYKLQYGALKKKLREFPGVRFLVWTGAVQVSNDTDEESARRAKAFFQWVRTEWDEKGDNIYLWDFYELETEGELYAKPAYTSGDAHPNEVFSRKVAPLFGQRLVDVIQGRGDSTSLTGRGGAATTAPEPTASPETPAPDPQPAAQPPAAAMPEGAGERWVFDDAEDKSAGERLWGGGARYVTDGGGNVIRLDFASGREEDWGEYGRQRIIVTASPERNRDISGFRYLVLRLKADREMEVVATLLTLPDPARGEDQSHFGFTAYLHPQAGEWKTVAIDLTKLELTAEGEDAYAKAGRPTRPMQFTSLKLVTSVKHEKAQVLLDDITFRCELPESLRSAIQAP